MHHVLERFGPEPQLMAQTSRRIQGLEPGHAPLGSIERGGPGQLPLPADPLTARVDVEVGPVCKPSLQIGRIDMFFHTQVHVGKPAVVIHEVVEVAHHRAAEEIVREGRVEGTGVEPALLLGRGFRAKCLVFFEQDHRSPRPLQHLRNGQPRDASSDDCEILHVILVCRA